MYASLAEFKTWLQLPVEDDELLDHQMEPVLLAADRWIDQQCGRHFSLENDVTKLYNPTSANYLDVVDLVSVTTLKLDTRGDRTFATTLDTDDYELLPSLDEAGRPSERYTQVGIWPSSSHGFTPGELVQIVGDFGYVVDGATPADIRLASLILASRWWKRHETPLGVLGSTDLGTFERISKSDPDLTMLLESYSRASASSWVLV